MTTAEWVMTVGIAALAAIGTLAAAWAAAISAKASMETARLLQAEHDTESVRRDLEPLLRLHHALGEFLARITEETEDVLRNELRGRVRITLEHPALTDTPLTRTNKFVDAGWEVGTTSVEHAEAALQEVNALIQKRI